MCHCQSKRSDVCIRNIFETFRQTSLSQRKRTGERSCSTGYPGGDRMRGDQEESYLRFGIVSSSRNLSIRAHQCRDLAPIHRYPSHNKYRMTRHTRDKCCSVVRESKFLYNTRVIDRNNVDNENKNSYLDRVSTS